MNPPSSSKKQINCASSRSLRLQPNECKYDDDDVELDSALLSQSSRISTISHNVALSSQNLPKRGPSNVTSPSTTTNRNSNKKQSSSQDNKCPHCEKPFSKRFSIPKHVQVSILSIAFSTNFLNIYTNWMYPVVQKQDLTNFAFSKTGKCYIPHFSIAQWKRVHDRTGELHCPFCKFKCLTNNEMKDHERRVHRTCPYCSKVFVLLDRHLATCERRPRT